MRRFKPRIITLAIELVKEAIESELPFETVLFDSWYLARLLMEVLAERGRSGFSILKMNRNITTNKSASLNDENKPIRSRGHENQG